MSEIIKVKEINSGKEYSIIDGKNILFDYDIKRVILCTYFPIKNSRRITIPIDGENKKLSVMTEISFDDILQWANIINELNEINTSNESSQLKEVFSSFVPIFSPKSSNEEIEDIHNKIAEQKTKEQLENEGYIKGAIIIPLVKDTNIIEEVFWSEAFDEWCVRTIDNKEFTLSEIELLE